MQLFSFGTDFLAYSKQKKIPPTEGFLFTSNSKAVLQGMACKIWVRGWDEFSTPSRHFVSPPSHWWKSHNHSDKKRRHTTIRTERGA